MSYALRHIYLNYYKVGEFKAYNLHLQKTYYVALHHMPHVAMNHWIKYLFTETLIGNFQLDQSVSHNGLK